LSTKTETVEFPSYQVLSIAVGTHNFCHAAGDTSTTALFNDGQRSHTQGTISRIDSALTVTGRRDKRA